MITGKGGVLFFIKMYGYEASWNETSTGIFLEVVEVVHMGVERAIPLTHKLADPFRK
jgi:hypothetical protein